LLLSQDLSHVKSAFINNQVRGWREGRKRGARKNCCLSSHAHPLQKVSRELKRNPVLGWMAKPITLSAKHVAPGRKTQLLGDCMGISVLGSSPKILIPRDSSQQSQFSPLFRALCICHPARAFLLVSLSENHFWSWKQIQ